MGVCCLWEAWSGTCWSNLTRSWIIHRVHLCALDFCLVPGDMWYVLCKHRDPLGRVMVNITRIFGQDLSFCCLYYQSHARRHSLQDLNLWKIRSKQDNGSTSQVMYYLAWSYPEIYRKVFEVLWRSYTQLIPACVKHEATNKTPVCPSYHDHCIFLKLFPFLFQCLWDGILFCRPGWPHTLGNHPISAL